MVKKKLVKFVVDCEWSAFWNGLRPHHAPSCHRCVHSQAWQLRNANPPMIVRIIYKVTFLRSPLWPAATASTMVTELMIRIKVIRLTNTNGRLVCGKPGKALKASLGSGQLFEANLSVP